MTRARSNNSGGLRYRSWAPRASQLFKGGVAQHQPLDAGAAEVDLRLGLFAAAARTDDCAQAPGIVGDPITGRQIENGPVAGAPAQAAAAQPRRGELLLR